MAFTEFYVQTTGSNLNAGSTNTDAATRTYASGTWVQSTGVFTVASGDPVADGVNVGDWASVYADGSTTTGFVGRVTARTSTTITVSLSAKSGTAPTDGTNNRTLKIGGAWKGPNGSEGFPFGFFTNAMTNASGDTPRVNFKNGVNYAITSGINHSSSFPGPAVFQGYTSSPGDGGRAVIDGGTTGTSYTLLTWGAARALLEDFIIQNNGNSSGASGVAITTTTIFRRVTVHDVMVNGFLCSNVDGMTFIECEAYNCNTSNSANSAGFKLTLGATLDRCVSHDNSGSNTDGFLVTADAGNVVTFNRCIADSNGRHGFNVISSSLGLRSGSWINCDAYGNSGAGLTLNQVSATNLIENCNFVGNGTYGINRTDSNTHAIRIVNCGFHNNTTAATNGLGNAVIDGSVTYTGSPYADAANGDFTISSAEAKGAGRGAFTMTGGYSGSTTATLDIGAGEHQDAGGGGNTYSRGRIVNGG